MNLTRIMAEIAPDTKWMSIDDTYENLTMLDGSEKPSLETFEAAEILINAEIEQEELYQKDWEEINKYFDKDIPKYTNPTTGNTFDITTSSLLDIERKEKIAKDDAVINWSTDKDNEFSTTKAELFIVLQKADELRQLKVNEVRGL